MATKKKKTGAKVRPLKKPLQDPNNLTKVREAENRIKELKTETIPQINLNFTGSVRAKRLQEVKAEINMLRAKIKRP